MTASIKGQFSYHQALFTYTITWGTSEKKFKYRQDNILETTVAQTIQNIGYKNTDMQDMKT